MVSSWSQALKFDQDCCACEKRRYRCVCDIDARHRDALRKVNDAMRGHTMSQRQRLSPGHTSAKLANFFVRQMNTEPTKGSGSFFVSRIAGPDRHATHPQPAVLHFVAQGSEELP
jgi:hypothetical protein